MNIEKFLSESISKAVNGLFELNSKPEEIILQKTKKDIEADFTLVTFPFIKAAKLSPEKTGELIGEAILKEIPELEKYDVVKGFLNFTFLYYHSGFWCDYLLFQHVDCYNENFDKSYHPYGVSF